MFFLFPSSTFFLNLLVLTSAPNAHRLLVLSHISHLSLTLLFLLFPFFLLLPLTSPLLQFWPPILFLFSHFSFTLLFLPFPFFLLSSIFHYHSIFILHFPSCPFSLSSPLHSFLPIFLLFLSSTHTPSPTFTSHLVLFSHFSLPAFSSLPLPPTACRREGQHANRTASRSSYVTPVSASHNLNMSTSNTRYWLSETCSHLGPVIPPRPQDTPTPPHSWIDRKEAYFAAGRCRRVGGVVTHSARTKTSELEVIRFFLSFFYVLQRNMKPAKKIKMAVIGILEGSITNFRRIHHNYVSTRLSVKFIWSCQGRKQN